MAGKIKKLLENELVGGTQSNDVYPVTSVKAVYDEDNERLDNIIRRKGVVNISTNYNSDHIAEVLTLEQAIAKVPSSDRVLGFQGKFLTSKGWKVYQFLGDSIADWTDVENWDLSIYSKEILQEVGNNTSLPISQKMSSLVANPLLITKSAKINPYIKELYISGSYNDTPANELSLYIVRAGCIIHEAGNHIIFLYIGLADGTENNLLSYQTPDGVDEGKSQYHKVSKNGLTLEFISRLEESPYGWNAAPDTIENSTLNSRAFDINFSPTIKSIHLQETTEAWQDNTTNTINTQTDTLGKTSLNNLYVKSPKFVPFLKEIYVSGTYNGKDISEQKVYIQRAGLSEANEEEVREVFFNLMDEDGNSIVTFQKEVDNGGYYKSNSVHNVKKGVTMEIVVTLQNSPYNWNAGTDTLENSLLTSNAFDLNVSPTIKAIHLQNTVDNFVDERVFAIDNNDNKVANFIKELYISSNSVDISNIVFTIKRLFKYEAGTTNIVCGISISDSNEGGYYFEFIERGKVFNGYKCLTTSNGINFEFVIDFENNPYDYGKVTDTVIINRYAQNIDFSPTIKAIHNNTISIANTYDIKNIDLSNINLLYGYLKAADGLFVEGGVGYYISTDFIPVKTIFDIEYSLVYRWTTSACCVYDSNKNFIKTLVNPSQDEQTFSGKLSELQLPPNAAYIRFCGINGGTSISRIELLNSKNFNNSSILKDKRGYFIGDSIMIGNDKVETTLSITKFIKEEYGMNCINNARGGAVLTSSEKHYAPIYKMLTSIPKDADYIIMQGGVNGMAKDATGEAPWGWGSISDGYEDEFDTVLQLPCLEAMCKYVVTNFPDKKYGFIITYKIGSWKGYWDEKSELIKQVLEKWGIPYLDWRQCGITLASEAIREKYGVDAFASYPEYSNQETYEVDDRVIYEGKGYKANTTISEPEEWTPEHWDVISETRYDSWHCNAVAYKQLADKTAKWMESL